MPVMYYGSKMSDNMTKTPEGYLICHNVPIGRTGWMDYLGEELGLTELSGKVIKVYRSPEELFSKATMASFEGKSVTNNHPSKNIDINSVATLERGHVENIRQQGELLVADLFIKDQGLIFEVENGKREVSCGYDCLWEPLVEDNTKFEQKEIVGNHVAVVQNGRAGSRVAIKDSLPEIKEGGKKKMKSDKVTKGFLAALGLKHYAQDADPEDLQKAMDAMGEEGMQEEPEVKDEDQGAEDGRLSALEAKVDQLISIIDRLVKSDEEVHEEVGADAELEGLETELTTDADPEEEEVKDEDPEEGIMDEESEVVESDGGEEKKPANDAMAAFVRDMKPIIMAIPDEAIRNKTAKDFTAMVRKSVKDSKAAGIDGYGQVAQNSINAKRKAMDNQMAKTSQADAARQAADAFNKLNPHYNK